MSGSWGQQKGQRDDQHQRGDPSWAICSRCNWSQRCLFLSPSTPNRSAGWFFVGSALVPSGLLRIFPVILQEVALGGIPDAAVSTRAGSEYLVFP